MRTSGAVIGAKGPGPQGEEQAGSPLALLEPQSPARLVSPLRDAPIILLLHAGWYRRNNKASIHQDSRHSGPHQKI
jgi:hypothetical protein